MTTNHRAEAEELLKQAAKEAIHPEGDPTHALAAAQAHALLARDEEQAARTSDMRDALRLLRQRDYDVRKAVSKHIAKALASREPNRWRAGRELAQALDMADCNVDDAVDACLSDDGWDPRSAWKAVGSAVRSDDPWAPAPDITAQIPEPVRRVIAGHLAEALLDGRDSDVQKWARGIAYELKNIGADLTDAIKQQITDMTLGGDPTDPPF
ncbi:hypothetical protein [Streptomyces sp. NPDC057115]|uniref:hypothetical protein n=1 Tax=Streptomyces sp. NPDC057115 TaxID=3346022 RepID=UPI003644AAD9